MLLSPLFLASSLSRFDGFHLEYSWKQLAKAGRHDFDVSSVKMFATRQEDPIWSVLPHKVSLPLDHAGTIDARFNNRFWLNATFYEPGGPVIFYDVGESDSQIVAEQTLTEVLGSNTAMTLARRYKGLAIVWEHRFYGESFPATNLNKTFAPEWKYHTVQQALDDVVVFANKFANVTSTSALASNPLEYYAVHPSKVPWIAFSGSYPGARVTFLRQEHPEIIFAGWGSSVCSHSDAFAPDYYSVIQRTLPKACAADWAAIRRYVDIRSVGNRGSVV